MRRLATLVLLLASCVGAAAIDSAAIDAEARRLMHRESVQGLALAVIEGGQVAHVAAYGQRSVERELALNTDTILYAASLTKTAFAYLVLQLVDEGLIELDAPVSRLLPRPLPQYTQGDDNYADLAGDDRWQQLTPRMLLTHSAGFANFRWLEPDKRLRMHFDPGSRYAYSGEGFYLLQMVLEQGLGMDVGKEMQKRVFDRFGMTRTSMSWRPDFADNLADGYARDGKMQPHRERSRASAAGSMDSSITDQARMWAGIMRGDGLSAKQRAELVRPQLAIATKRQFPTLAQTTDPRNREVGLSAGLGLVTFMDTSGPAWFKGGHNPWTGNMVVCLEAGQRCVVMLANDVRAERLFPALARKVLGPTRMPWRWEYD